MAAPLRSLSRAWRPSKCFPSARTYSTHPPNARLNTEIDYKTTPLLHHTSSTCLANPELPESAKSSTTSRQNLFQSVNSALAHALRSNDSTLLFGEDVAFGGVFRCSMNLATEFGSERVFNTPLSEQGIVGFAIGCAMEGMRPIAEIQFADYVYPAFDQLVNEAAKVRYRAGTNPGMHAGGLVVRMPAGGVGHGALYHSQSPEALFTHIPGLRVVIPRSPVQAKGLLLASIECNDPVVFLEPKILYRAAVEQVPVAAYTLPLDKAEILKQGSDVTIISYGTPLYTCQKALEAAEKDFGISCELIDLRTIYPWDRETVVKSVSKTGRAVIVHESMINAGVGAEVAATIQEGCFLTLEAPVQRICGWSTHMGLVYERFNVPDVARIYDGIKKAIQY
ncbi:thiamine diphosphate-binding protein [Aulographum hederae CBS 113979]|uniref:3-methyl-2-oxobutanoate dehydrogenase (2-methylpropanoyl-transferring) n=1 Tax=Aulographum hederae CBS 113979 TaxID=1176131 RepID=A0A6G1GMH1_9PEZI|nr:thiamine diphosphate-binding protein [Aulographum hederae CBS 113979]